jgi:hypothetical protein
MLRLMLSVQSKSHVFRYIPVIALHLIHFRIWCNSFVGHPLIVMLSCQSKHLLRMYSVIVLPDVGD